MVANTPQTPQQLQQFIGHRYRLIERLGAGGMGTVYRAYDRLTGQTVALKQVHAPTEHLQFATRLSLQDSDPRVALAQEFRALASLRHPNIIAVRDYGFDADGQPFFTMDLLDSARSILEIGRGQAQPTRIDLIIQTLQALVYLHRRGIIHRDLKPSNVLVSGGALRVLDFGLSIPVGQAEEAIGTAGTIAYMAPEVLGDEGLPTPAADLYAVGVMLYELLVGRHPFDASNTYAMIFAVMNNLPDLSMVENAGLVYILERLLAKTPEERYTDARHVIEALCDATDHPLPRETQAIRESFLQAARLVGRDAELARLTEALDLALAGNGSAWLVAGESGVGKSRLLEELRTLALVRGALTVRGQAVGEGGSPYQPWQDVLRRLVIATPYLTDREASVLKPVVTDMDMLIGRPVADPPAVDPQSARTRLLSTVGDLLKRQTQPVVIILEDFHWAGNESLELLAWLSRQAAYTMDLPLLLIASYREDEMSRQFAPEMQIIRLRRLSQENTAELAESMLGIAGRQPELVEFLHTETEGNAFFLVEAVRALAEEAGRLEHVGAQIDAVGLPEHITAGGVQRIVRRRLDRVPGYARPLLQVAALLGRQPDLDVLEATDPAQELEMWLDQLADTTVFDVFEGRWRFAHEKLREAILEDLSLGERRALHRRIAVAYEQVYASKPESAALLAYHWAQAGEIGKEMEYTAQAGGQALRSGAYTEAKRLLDRAVELFAKLNAAPTRAGGKGGAISATQYRQAVLENQLADVHYALGSLAESQQHSMRAMALLGQALPGSNRAMLFALVAQLFRQIAHRLRPGRVVSDTPRPIRAALLEAVRAHERFTMLTWIFSQLIPGLFGALRGLNLAEQAGDKAAIARLSAIVGTAASVVRRYGLAENYIRRALKLSEEAHDAPARLWVLVSVSLYFCATGQWARTRDTYIEAMEIADRLKDRIRLQDSARFLAWATERQGDLARVTQMQNDLREMAKRGQDPLYEAYALVGSAAAAFLQGRMDEATAQLEDARGRIGGQPDIRNTIVWLHGLLALIYWRQGRADDAEQIAAIAEQTLHDAPAAAFFAMDGITSLAQMRLEMAEMRGSADKFTRRACRMLSRFAWRYPVARPAALRALGQLAWLDGRQRLARRLWERSLTLSTRLTMPYDTARTHFEIGKRADSAERLSHLREARDVFMEIGATVDAAQTRELLGKFIRQTVV